MIRSLFLVAGELSSDRYAARLVTALRERIPDLRAEAVGGPHLKAAGVPLFRDSSQWSAIGIAEALRRIAPIWLGNQALKRRLKASPPDLLVLLDFGAFNVPTGNYARRLGIPVAYAIPPGSWRPDGGKVSPKLASCADVFFSPFLPSAKTLTATGLDAHWLGHPLLDFLPDATSRDELRHRFGLEESGPVVALLPGSRRQELTHLTPVMLEACRQLSEQVNGIRFLLPLAASLKGSGFEDRLKPFGWSESPSASGNSENETRRFDGPAPLFIATGRAMEALAAADAAMVCSGTATLEAALVGCPMVIGYTGGKSMGLEYLIRKAVVPKYIGLPNLLLDRFLCPELIAEAFTPERLVEEVRPLLIEGQARADQMEGFQQLRSRLGDPGVIDRWADFIVERWGEGSSSTAASHRAHQKDPVSPPSSKGGS